MAARRRELEKIVSASRRNQHPSRVHSPERDYCAHSSKAADSPRRDQSINLAAGADFRGLNCSGGL